MCACPGMPAPFCPFSLAVCCRTPKVGGWGRTVCQESPQVHRRCLPCQGQGFTQANNHKPARTSPSILQIRVSTATRNAGPLSEKMPVLRAGDVHTHERSHDHIPVHPVRDPQRLRFPFCIQGLRTSVLQEKSQVAL